MALDPAVRHLLRVPAMMRFRRRMTGGLDRCLY
jgi:hypothetical protein